MELMNKMANILEKIVHDKRIEIDALKSAKPLASFIDELVPSTKDMLKLYVKPMTNTLLPYQY